MAMKVFNIEAEGSKSTEERGGDPWGFSRVRVSLGFTLNRMMFFLCPLPPGRGALRRAARALPSAGGAGGREAARGRAGSRPQTPPSNPAPRSFAA